MLDHLACDAAEVASVEVRVQGCCAKEPGFQRTGWLRWFPATRWMNDRLVSARPRVWARAGFGWLRLDLTLALLLSPPRVHKRQRVNGGWSARRVGRQHHARVVLSIPAVGQGESLVFPIDRGVQGRQGDQ